MQVVVISDYQKCLKLVNQLKLCAGKYKKCLEHNKNNEDRITIKRKTRFCCGQKQILDGEDFYKEQIKDLSDKI
jgi:hypothetical protein